MSRSCETQRSKSPGFMEAPTSTMSLKASSLLPSCYGRRAGGTLYCDDPALKADALASGIKFLARITSGVSVFEESLEDGRVDIRNGDIGTPNVVSNVPISW